MALGDGNEERRKYTELIVPMQVFFIDFYLLVVCRNMG